MANGINDEFTFTPLAVEIEQPIPQAQLPQVQSQPQNDDLDKLLFKLRSCPNFHTLFALEDEFNKVGLTLQTTSQGWLVLCKVINNRPASGKIMDDYIFIANLSRKDEDVPERLLNIVIDFIQTNATAPTKVQDFERVWRNGVRVYDRAISIMHEDINVIAQNMIID